MMKFRQDPSIAVLTAVAEAEANTGSGGDGLSEESKA